MSELYDTLNNDLRDALKGRRQLETSTLRYVIGAIQTEEKSGKTARTLTDADILKLISKEVKTRRETAGIFAAAGRDELADKENAEANLLEAYLPKRLDASSLNALVESAVLEVGATSMRDMGKVIKIVNEQAAGAADGKSISDAVKARLQG